MQEASLDEQLPAKSGTRAAYGKVLRSAFLSHSARGGHVDISARYCKLLQATAS